MNGDVFSWWAFLSTIATLNIAAWAYAAWQLQRRRPLMDAEAFALRRAQLLLSAGYVFGCAYRSYLPVFDVPRLCLVDSWLSSVVVGRSVATIAELCFVAQWALILRATSRATGSSVGGAISSLLVPMIAVAETCSWYAVLTTSNLGHVIEETLWGLGAALLVISLVEIWPRCARRLRPLLAVWGAAGLGYVFFMFLVDVPMYWSRWLADEATGRHYMSLAQGLLDASSRWVVSHRWADWHSEVAWMSLYFSVAVWLSIALIHAPLPAGRRLRPH
ncbi:hypothetical protein [Zoogloea dura]|uniref:Uncharacterized protein n=1 Tax=Zoogloea dura TaxID=2728840 RepID=A0A848G1G4_9RHOO|nr:hypothetical protein [Zoogloea dura]NML25062.1 hypothetical protein [Zoogloea dura]